MIMSDSAGWKPESSKAAPMWRISLKVLSGERKAACLRVPSTRCWTIMRFTGVSASARSTVCNSVQLRPGTCPSVSVIGHPFRLVTGGDGGAGSDWGRFGYRVIRNSLVRDKQQGRIDATGGVQLARGVLAVSIDGRWLDAQTTRDLFGVQVGVDEAETFALTLGQSISSARHRRPPGSRRILNTRKDSPKRGLRRTHAIGACRRRLHGSGRNRDGGLTENRTRVQGFAVLCVTTPPSGHGPLRTTAPSRGAFAIRSDCPSQRTDL